MSPIELHFSSFSCLPASLRQDYCQFLAQNGLHDENDADFTVLALDEADTILACGSLRETVLKQIAVCSKEEGSGLCAQIVTLLVEEAVRRGDSHLFLYTKPAHHALFASMGFSPIIQTESILMMENVPNGFASFLSSLPHPNGRVGAVVCNCNPFTLGHRHLIEYAAAHCDRLLVFVLSEDLSLFPADVRFRLVQEGVQDLGNVFVVQSRDYLISRATFPTYFLKDSVDADQARCDLDLQLFARGISPALHIAVRFIGEEPFDPITRKYNERMKAVLPAHGIEVVEIPRCRDISASRVRQLLKKGNLQDVKSLVPPCTYQYCRDHFGADAPCP